MCDKSIEYLMRRIDENEQRLESEDETAAYYTKRRIRFFYKRLDKLLNKED